MSAALSASLVAAVAASGCGSVAKPAAGGGAKKAGPTKVTIVEAVNAPSVSGPGIIALAEGYFKQQGIQAEFIRGGGGANVEMLMGSGSAQFGVTGASEIPHTSQGPGQPTAVLPIRTRVLYTFVVRKSVAQKRGIRPGLPLKTALRKLKGLSIVGSSAKAQATLMANYVLQRNGFNPKGYWKWVYAGDPNSRASAFLGGDVDIIALANAVDRGRVLSTGKAVVAFDTSSLPPFDNSLVLLATKKMISGQPDVVQKVVTAFVRADAFLGHHPNQSIKALQSFYKGKMRANLVAASYRQDVAPDLPTRVQPSLGYRMTAQQWQGVDQMDVSIGLIPKAVNPGQGVMWTDQFVKSATAS